ncbi:MAG TPA: ABC transporter substrate-binding protein [Candidatus Acidoferrum sp.]|nr:ABC transporter substrate-binding protein [Candidatus Acidoferrum sp.]
MKLTFFQSLALASAFLLLAASPVRAAEHPHYGGTLRLEMSAASISMDPRQWKVGSLEAAANEKLAALVFERLVSLDNYGRFQPALATEWSHDASYRRWQFAIRSGVKFSDGSELQGADVVAALEPLLPGTQKISAVGSAIVIQSAVPAPDLLEQLASGRYLVFRILSNGSLAGTGPFVLADASSNAPQSGERDSAAARNGSSNDTSARSAESRLYFRANPDAWSGRPFLDSIDVSLGVPPLRALFDLQLGKAELIELSPDLVPRAKQSNLRVWSSDQVTLYGVRFDAAQSASSDARLREALALSLDRETMANVLLQKQADPAASLLPQWLSGYAFLFDAKPDLDQTSQLKLNQPVSDPPGREVLRLRIDPPGDLAKLLGERVAINARQAGISVQVLTRPAAREGGDSTSQSNSAAAHLFVWRYSSLSSREELESLFAAYNLLETPVRNFDSAGREQLYARERKVLEDWRVLPLVTEPECVGLGAMVHNWMPARWGEWHLEDVWLELPQSGEKSGMNTITKTAPERAAQPAVAGGGKP